MLDGCGESTGFKMTIANIATIGLLVGIAACGSLFAWLFRREPRKVLNIAVLTLGFALLAFGYLRWAAKHESPEVKEAMFIRYVVAGWALVGMGFVGLQCGRDSTTGGES
jgi:4-hydroxybenzoate polyprenyltransferase